MAKFRALAVTLIGSVALAAVATAVMMQAASAPRPFRADHPFLLLIGDTPSETILFVGRVTDPR